MGRVLPNQAHETVEIVTQATHHGGRSLALRLKHIIYIFRQFVRNRPVETVGKKCSGVPCASEHIGGRPCRGRLYDGVLDWEHSLPENDLLMAEWHSR